MDSLQFYSVSQMHSMYNLQSHILLIDDDLDDLEILSTILEEKDIRVETFQSPAEALGYLADAARNAELPSLIVLDYNMPQQNGYQVLLSIKKNNDIKDIPIVIHSTNMSNLLKKQLSDAGACACFRKPWTYQELAAQANQFQELCTSFTKTKLVSKTG